MSSQWQGFSKKSQLVFQLLLAIASIIFIYSIFPKINRFQYDFEKGKPWQYDDLYADFDFDVLKSEAQVDAEKSSIKDEHIAHLVLDEAIQPAVYKQYKDLIEARFTQLDSVEAVMLDEAKILDQGKRFIDSIYAFGLIQTDFDEIVIVDNARDIISVSPIYFDKINSIIEKRFQSNAANSLITPILKSIIEVNINYDENLNEQLIEAKFESIQLILSNVQKGQVIVEKGEVVNEDVFQVLQSFEKSYAEKVLDESQMRWLAVGYFMVITVAISILLLYLFFYKPAVFGNFRHYFFILLLINLVLLATSGFAKLDSSFLLLIPYCIVPIVLRAFFKRELALYVHLVIVLIAGFFVPNAFHFIFIQTVAGIVAIYGNKDVRYWSQFFKAIGFIFLAYFFSYAGTHLISEGNFSIPFVYLGYLVANVVLTFLAYPLIPFFERIFGLISEISLAEYTDLNKPLLKKLSLEAPGTFQHSLQVANLAEAATSAIGGNSLLVKVGGLYHDIGKLSKPAFFIENQSGFNPHSKISYEQSAEIIISHVTEGLKMAKKEGLPSQIVDFIATHHGTTRVEYFYRLHTQEIPPEHVDEDKFVYPGPSPFTKEQAILMMADSVEAASKSLKSPTHDQLVTLIDKIVAHQMERKQFDNAPITFKEINTCKEVFVKILASIYHVRIAYPEDKK